MRRVHVNRTWIKDATAAIFDINNQLRDAQRQRHLARSKAGRRSRPDKRTRQAWQAENAS
ncbi:hypothetical protein C7G41_19460 [Bradyrhizobium sp. MOS002]|nr:hypothetical protein C7G41_19460 [Bradyrhizobium sp. MOS002]